YGYSNLFWNKYNDETQYQFPALISENREIRGIRAYYNLEYLYVWIQLQIMQKLSQNVDRLIIGSQHHLR
ncbi:hypothetical protein, partial [Bacteroides faecis]|uniref:hypothetical protein n=1 Tax=Bacteroides faecis TaxID=674529 RepID=UPI002350C625